MQTSHAKTIRGLSIATIVLSILSIVGLILCLLFLGVGGAALSDSGMRDSMSMSLEMDPEAAYAMENLGITSDDAFGIVALIFGLGIAYILWGIICSVVTLVAGIIGLRNCDSAAKLGKVFGWAIAGAILAFLYGNIVTLVLLIITAVCANKDRKAATAIPYGQPAAYYCASQQPYGAPPQPQYAAPQQPYAAPQQQQPHQPSEPIPQTNQQQ